MPRGGKYNNLSKLLRRYVKKLPNGCWEWQGGTSANGYGQAHLNYKNYPAHVLIYTLTKGPIPEDHELHHICHYRTCVNPDHLTPLTVIQHRRLHIKERIISMTEEVNLEVQPARFQSLFAGTKLFTIRNGHRRYAKSLSISCGPSKLAGICNTYIHTLLAEVPFTVLKEEGFLNIKECLDTLKIFYPNIGLESKVTIVEFRRAL